jgi:WD40 repeat protein
VGDRGRSTGAHRQAATELAREIQRAGASPEIQQAARGALAIVQEQTSAQQPPSGQALFWTGRAKLAEGKPVEAQRLFDRALLELEQETKQAVRIEMRSGLVENHDRTPRRLAWSPSGDRLAVAEKNQVWLAALDEPVYATLITSAAVTSLIFANEGASVVTGSVDGQLELWDALDGALLWSVPTRDDGLAAAVLAPDGESVLTASQRGYVDAWAVLDGQRIRELGTWNSDGGVSTMAISADGKLLALAATSWVYLWHLTRQQQIGEVGPQDRAIVSVALSHDGGMMATVATDDTKRVWRSSDGALLREWPGNRLFHGSVAFLPGAKQVLVTSGMRLRYWEPASGRLLKAFGEARNGEMAFSPDARWVATAVDPGVAAIWNAETGRLERAVGLHAEDESVRARAHVCRVGSRVFSFELCAERLLPPD